MKSVDEYGEYAKSLFMKGYNCSQSVVCAFSDVLDIDEKMLMRLSSPFGGGMGRLREVCGAVSGMFIVLGLLEGYDDISDITLKTELYKKVQKLAADFEAENGTIICRELLGLDKGKDSPVPEERTKEYYEKRPCPDKVKSAAKILAKYISEHNH